MFRPRPSGVKFRPLFLLTALANAIIILLSSRQDLVCWRPRMPCGSGFSYAMRRTTFFIDGFNLYHALNNVERLHRYKWLDFSRLVRCYVSGNDVIEDIYYFTALANWNTAKVQRHKVLLQAQRACGVKVVYGMFKKVDKACRLCHREYQTYEEKMTDVNIAVSLLSLAFQDRYDKAILISGDTDLVPAIEAVEKNFPDKEVGVVIPIGRTSEQLKQVCSFHMKMKEAHLKSCMFPEEIDLGQGKILRRPTTWA